MNWPQFFTMGGYAAYVWPVYAIATVILAFNAVQPFVRRQTILKRLRRYYRLQRKTR